MTAEYLGRGRWIYRLKNEHESFQLEGFVGEAGGLAVVDARLNGPAIQERVRRNTTKSRSNVHESESAKR